MNPKIKQVSSLLCKICLGILIIWGLCMLLYMFLLILNSKPREVEPYSPEEKKLYKELATELKIESVERYSESTQESRGGSRFELAVTLNDQQDYDAKCFDTIAGYVAKRANKVLKLGEDYKYYYIWISYYGKKYNGYRRDYCYDIDSLSKVNKIDNKK